MRIFRNYNLFLLFTFFIIIIVLTGCYSPTSKHGTITDLQEDWGDLVMLENDLKHYEKVKGGKKVKLIFLGIASSKKNKNIAENVKTVIEDKLSSSKTYELVTIEYVKGKKKKKKSTSTGITPGSKMIDLQTLEKVARKHDAKRMLIGSIIKKNNTYKLQLQIIKLLDIGISMFYSVDIIALDKTSIEGIGKQAGNIIAMGYGNKEKEDDTGKSKKPVGKKGIKTVVYPIYSKSERTIMSNKANIPSGSETTATLYGALLGFGSPFFYTASKDFSGSNAGYNVLAHTFGFIDTVSIILGIVGISNNDDPLAIGGFGTLVVSHVVQAFWGRSAMAGVNEDRQRWIKNVYGKDIKVAKERTLYEHHVLQNNRFRIGLTLFDTSF